MEGYTFDVHWLILIEPIEVHVSAMPWGDFK